MAKSKSPRKLAKQVRREVWGEIQGSGPDGTTRILGLDISSTNIGLCILHDRDAWLVRHFEYKSKDRDTRLRQMAADIRSWMFINRHLIDGLAYEAPALTETMKLNMITQAQAVGIVKAAWFQNSNPLQANNLIEVPIQHGKSALAGHYQADKETMIQCARVSFPSLEWNEHTADACGIGMAAYTYLEQSRQVAAYEAQMREE